MTRSDRPSLLAGTALASTLLLAAILGSSPAHAVTETIDDTNIVQNTDTATNVIPRNTTLAADVANAGFAEGLAGLIALANGAVIGGAYDQTGNIYLTTEVSNTANALNSGEIDAPLVGIASGVENIGGAIGNASEIAIVTGANVLGDLTQEANHVLSAGLLNTAYVDNSANVTADYIGILGVVANEALVIGNASATEIGNVFNVLGAVTQTANSDQVAALINNVTIVNTGDIDAEIGIIGIIFNGDVEMGNADAAIMLQGVDILGDLTQAATTTQTNAVSNAITIDSAGDIDAGEYGIGAVIYDAPLLLSAMGNAATSEVISGFDIDTDLSQSAANTQTNALVNTINIVNRGDIEAGVGAIDATIYNAGLDIGNAVNADVLTGYSVLGEHTQTATFDQTNAISNRIAVNNAGLAAGGEAGIAARIYNDGIEIGNLAYAVFYAEGESDAAQTAAINQTNTLTNEIVIQNSGEVRGGEIGVFAVIENNAINFDNYADIYGVTSSLDATQTVNVNQYTALRNTITVTNSGSIEGGDVGIVAIVGEPVYTATNVVATALDAPVQDENVTQQVVVESRIDIVNTGTITADSLFAIDTEGAATTITNHGGGVITGFVDLTDFDDVFDNQSGGTFDARRTSDFGEGFDQFVNRRGGTVQATGNTSFVNLNRFTNSGVISMVNGRTNDVFEISNTAGETDLDFRARSGSTLAVDAFLGGPGSKADNFIINGDVTGRTQLTVNNTSSGPGALNREGIPVVFANANVSKRAFYLEKPVDTGFFDYDLHFVKTGSGFFELRSHPGGGSHVLPHLPTAAQDIFFIGTDTWFDRSADLRVLLNSGAPSGYRPDAQYVNGAQPGITPAVWVKGAGTWLEQDDKAKTEAFGRTYRYDLKRDLDVAHFQTGIDFGAHDVLSPGDMLIYGVLGGAIFGNLDYNQIVRQFDISGGEVGAYATYLKGGLFVDTLLKADFVEFDPNGTVGFPGSFNSTAWGVRTDAGYRFGSFQRGLFFEPLATIAFNWTDVEDFAVGANKVVLHDESFVRGRLGLRLGTSTEVWTGTLMEPFVIGSVWGNLGSDTNRATLYAQGSPLHFEDDLEDVWGVVSAGVNFFNFAATTSVFAKVDVTFGDETEGVSGKGGLRVSW